MSKNILIVDDSPSIRNMLKVVMHPLGMTLHEAAGGRAGLEKVRSTDFALIITDQNMPGMDGLAMVKAIRSGEHNRDVPILVLTTETSDEMKAAFREAGANAWMSKPFTPERLEAALVKLIRI